MIILRNYFTKGALNFRDKLFVKDTPPPPPPNMPRLGLIPGVFCGKLPISRSYILWNINIIGGDLPRTVGESLVFCYHECSGIYVVVRTILGCGYIVENLLSFNGIRYERL